MLTFLLLLIFADMGTSPQIYTVTILRAPNAKTHVYDDLLLLIFQSDPSNDEMIVGQA